MEQDTPPAPDEPDSTAYRLLEAYRAVKTGDVDEDYIADLHEILVRGRKYFNCT